MEKIYGSGKNSMGQLRASVIPYSLAIIYINYGGKFNLQKIWKDQALNQDLIFYLTELMKLINDAIKKYSESDDYNEYSRKEELWISIKRCDEVIEFINRKDLFTRVSKYIRAPVSPNGIGETDSLVSEIA